MLKCLFKNRADFNAKDNYHRLPSHFAAENASVEILKYLQNIEAENIA
jgi:hypothetical protein